MCVRVLKLCLFCVEPRPGAVHIESCKRMWFDAVTRIVDSGIVPSYGFNRVRLLFAGFDNTFVHEACRERLDDRWAHDKQGRSKKIHAFGG